MDNPERIKEKINSNTRLVWIETPTNPLLNIIDIEEIHALVKRSRPDILIAVDNTFATPFLQRPLELGADITMHSVTKYLAGHSDVVMGAIIVNDQSLADRLAFIQNSCGAVPGPQDCFLVLRGIKTLHLRMERHCDNAMEIATFLQRHSAVEKVFYPGLPSHKSHEIAKKQMSGFGGMLSFQLKGDRAEDVKKFLERVKLFTLAESLGGVESLCGHPATMTHASIPREDREKAGLKDSLIRLSIGVEDAEDLIEDLKRALE